MNEYTIFCTPEQSFKALKLGASLYKLSMSVDDSHLRDKSIRIDEENELIDYAIPTAEQMIGWLEEKGIAIILKSLMDGDGICYCWLVHTFNYEEDLLWRDDKMLSRKEATLAAIDAALEYLTNTKK